MKTFTIFLSLLLTSLSALSDSISAEPFKVPRSAVVEVTDPISKLTYPLFIKLPKSYRKNENKRYPVIYLTDAWYAFQIISGATRYPMNFNFMKEAIIVGISYSKGSKGASSRNRDYTPTFDKYYKDKTGGAKKHAAFIEKSVFSYLDENYRTDPSNRTFVGNSFGGLFGTYILLNTPHMFKNYILGSPSYWWDNKYIFKLESAFAKQEIAINANVYLSIGELESKTFGSRFEMVNDAKLFYNKMLAWRQENLNIKLTVIADADHSTAFPTTAIQGLKWVLGNCNKSTNCLSN